MYSPFPSDLRTGMFMINSKLPLFPPLFSPLKLNHSILPHSNIESSNWLWSTWTACRWVHTSGSQAPAIKLNPKEWHQHCAQCARFYLNQGIFCCKLKAFCCKLKAFFLQMKSFCSNWDASAHARYILLKWDYFAANERSLIIPKPVKPPFPYLCSCGCSSSPRNKTRQTKPANSNSKFSRKEALGHKDEAHISEKNQTEISVIYEENLFKDK